ncbi:hypothetical protein DM02DRAFT_320733 [Periconia macrospinosa]|uniref:Uncharacterized protein n=1 Tax=Periconia macrospinosa TaxID=97972 RepID=A0A2V1EDF0_9PLEO|nr:hypothetical protein DM02DRAFT_320733 [Periconia macrospinosa]
MGIPGLTRRLEPHATRYQPEDLSGYQAIIDGPSLAYHAHRLALYEIGDEPRVPSYADINRLAFRWLVALEALNIKVLAICQRSGHVTPVSCLGLDSFRLLCQLEYIFSPPYVVESIIRFLQLHQVMSPRAQFSIALSPEHLADASFS